MFEIIVSIIVVSCIIYLFKGEFFRRKAVVTVVENLPLDIFKKKDKNKNKEVKEYKDENSKESKNNKEIETVKVEDSYNEEEKVYENTVQIEDEDISEEVEISEYDNKIEDLISIDIIDENQNNINEKSTYIGEIKIDIDEKKEENIESYINAEEIEEDTDILTEETLITVYWTPKGKSYHMSSTCRTLSRSKVINSGTLQECDRQYACEHCK